jgi:hypothetical protein
MDAATIAEMAKRGTYYVPTIDHNRYYLDNADKIWLCARISAEDAGVYRKESGDSAQGA